MENGTIKYDKLEDLPSLPKDWVRLVHRCRAISLGRNIVNNIKENGLIFNREASKTTPSQRGGTYPSPGYMVSAYNEELFWKNVEKDDFFIFDDAKYADTQIVFDMPIDQYCFLEKFGRAVIGKIDSKYIVGVIPNYNGYNKKLTLPVAEVLRAKEISINNPPAPITPPTNDELFAILQKRFATITKERVIHSIKEEKENLLYEINESLTAKKQPIIPQIHQKQER